MAISPPSVTLYTAHHCPFAHRIQIALRELRLPFTTSLVDITIPRTPEYLAINPTGMVPALDYNGHVFTESGLIAQFLADTSHGHDLLKASSDNKGALERFEIGYFVEAFSKGHAKFDAVVFAQGTMEEKTRKAETYVEAVVRTLEPLLEGAAPFFGGAKRLTLAEVMTGPFVLRVLSLAKYEQLVPGFVLTALEKKAPRFWAWAHAVVAEESVTAIWDENLVVRRTLERTKKPGKVS